MAFKDPDNRRRPDDYIDRGVDGVGSDHPRHRFHWSRRTADAWIAAKIERPATAQRSELPNTAPNAPSIPTPAPPKPQ